MNRHTHDERFESLDEETFIRNQRWLEQSGPALFPEPCALAMQRYDRFVVSLPEVADLSLANAVEKRRREFSGGRIAAHAALKKLGAGDSLSIPVGDARNPLWPAGFTGSITHTAGLAIAVVARTERLAAVGIDLELANAVQPELWPSLLRAPEIELVSRMPAAEQSRWATMMFSAKESFYKLQYPLTGEWVDFLEAEVSISEKTGCFELFCSQSSVVRKLEGSRFAGRHLVGPEFLLTALWLSPGQMQLPT